jgi:hypothetical protein
LHKINDLEFFDSELEIINVFILINLQLAK